MSQSSLFQNLKKESNFELLTQISSILEEKDHTKTHSLLSAMKILSEHLEEIE